MKKTSLLAFAASLGLACSSSSGDSTGAGGSPATATNSSSSTGDSPASTAASTAASTSASTGAGGAGGAPADPCQGRLVCEDFESQTMGAEPGGIWQTSTNAGSLAIDGMHTHSGTKAVHVHTDAGQYKSAMFFRDGAPTFPIASNVLYARMMIYMDQTANDGVHWTMLQGSGPLANMPNVTALYRYGGMWMGNMMANYETYNAGTDCWFNSNTKMPTGKWTCMEAKLDGPNNEMSFWLDGVEVMDLHVKDQGMGCINHDLGDMWLAPNFSRMTFGWESYQQDDARDAWIDDVVIDDKPIGCPP